MKSSKHLHLQLHLHFHHYHLLNLSSFLNRITAKPPVWPPYISSYLPMVCNQHSSHWDPLNLQEILSLFCPVFCKCSVFYSKWILHPYNSLCFMASSDLISFPITIIIPLINCITSLELHWLSCCNSSPPGTSQLQSLWTSCCFCWNALPHIPLYN